MMPLSSLQRSSLRGFTLIELLAVIGIIGILATTAFSSLSNSGARGRDVRRISDIDNVRKAFAMLDLEGVTTLGGACALSGSGSSLLAHCTPTSTFDFSALRDPSANLSTLCGPGSTGVCEYGIRNSAVTGSPTPTDYRIFFFLERGAGNLNAGLRQATKEGFE